MKVLWQDVTDGRWLGPEYYKKVHDLCQRIARPDTEIVFHHFEPGRPDRHYGDYIQYRFFAYLDNLQVIKGVVQAEKEGYDGVMINCVCDPMLREAREAVDIPVCAAGESSYLVACMLADKFAVVTSHSDLAPIIEDNIRAYGLQSRVIDTNPVRCTRAAKVSESDQVYYRLPWDSDKLIKPFEKVALECVEDGADLIVPGCTVLSAILTTSNYTKVKGTDAPILDNWAAQVKMIETLVDLKKSLGISASRLSYKSIKDVPDREEIMRSYNLE